MARYYNNSGANRFDKSVRLGETLMQVMEKKITPAANKSNVLQDAWLKVVPEHMKTFCSLEKISQGKVHIKVCSPSHLFEMRMYRDDLIQKLNEICPVAKVRQIRFFVG